MYLFMKLGEVDVCATKGGDYLLKTIDFYTKVMDALIF